MVLGTRVENRLKDTEGRSCKVSRTSERASEEALVPTLHHRILEIGSWKLERNEPCMTGGGRMESLQKDERPDACYRIRKEEIDFTCYEIREA